MNANLEALVEKAAEVLKKSKKVVIFTGAGISSDSGIETFRDEGGFWSGAVGLVALAVFGTPFGWKMTPGVSYRQYYQRFYMPIAKASPNDGHYQLAHWQNVLLKDKNFYIITQNVDCLHHRAGNKPETILEIHGTLRRHVCIKNRHVYDFGEDESSSGKLADIPSESPKCKECDSTLRPDCVLFTESLPDEYLDAHRISCNLKEGDVFVIVGTSGKVFPAASLPEEAKNNGASIIEINLEKTHYSEWKETLFLQGKSTEILTQITAKLKLK